MDVAFADLPIMRRFVRSELVIPIASPKRDEIAYEQAFVSIRKKLREGWLVGIFPEGLITYDGALNPFKKGVERIIERTPVLSYLWLSTGCGELVQSLGRTGLQRSHENGFRPL